MNNARKSVRVHVQRQDWGRRYWSRSLQNVNICGVPICFICLKIYNEGREMTCSDECHEELVRRLVAEFGEFKKVIRQSTGIAYRVPIRDIIERGIREENLDHYPRWEE